MDLVGPCRNRTGSQQGCHSIAGAHHRIRYATRVEIDFGLLLAILSHHLFKYDAPEALALGCCDGDHRALPNESSMCVLAHLRAT